MLRRNKHHKSQGLTAGLNAMHDIKRVDSDWFTLLHLKDPSNSALAQSTKTASEH